MKTLVILNPYANRWNAEKRWPQTQTALQAAGVRFDFRRTEKPGHGVIIAREAVEDGYECLIAAGGDSTINEVVNGIQTANIAARSKPALGVVPLGTANDLADNLGIPKELDAAARVIAGGQTNAMDVCQVNDRFFVNNSGVGLEPYITTIQMRIHRVQGITRYLLATLIGIYQKPEWEAEMAWDDGNYHGPATLVSIGNSPRTGGLFYLTPHANAFDGKLTFLVGSAPSRFQLLQMLPKAMKPGAGNVTEDRRAFEAHTTRLQINLNRPSPVHADGEVFRLDAQELSYQIFPGNQPIILPKTSPSFA